MQIAAKLIFFNILLFLPLFVFAEEQITISTYYPSPYGVYNELRSKKMAIGDTYYDAATTTIKGNADLVIEGDLGIGTNEPDRTNNWDKVVEERGLNHAKLLVSTTRQGIKAGIFSHSNWNGVAAHFGTASAHDVRIMTNYSDRMTVKSTGNVGIRNTNPTATLHVAGTLRLTGTAYGVFRGCHWKKQSITAAGVDGNGFSARVYCSTGEYAVSGGVTCGKDLHADDSCPIDSGWITNGQQGWYGDCSPYNNEVSGEGSQEGHVFVLCCQR